MPSPLPGSKALTSGSPTTPANQSWWSILLRFAAIPPQYAGLQQLWTRYRGRGLMIVGVPSNDFGGQEPGGTADIMRTAHGEYGIGFPLAAKAQVKGANPHPFYKWAAAERPLETPRWNFHKYLVGRDGHIAAVFATEIEPMDARVIDAIVKELPPPE